MCRRTSRLTAQGMSEGRFNNITWKSVFSTRVESLGQAQHSTRGLEGKARGVGKGLEGIG